MKDLRRQLNKQRKQLNHFQQTKSQHYVLNQLRRTSYFQSAQNIGVYLHAFGEIQTNKIIEYAFSCGKKIYLPMICNMNQRLVWVRISQHQYRNKRFSTHALGMKEPMASRGLHVSKLDLLLLPLIACDLYGTRIGMGGGFYDRTLASAQYKPFRLGLAHDFQLVQKTLIRENWDQPLNGLLTPTKLLIFKNN